MPDEFPNQPPTQTNVPQPEPAPAPPPETPPAPPAPAEPPQPSETPLLDAYAQRHGHRPEFESDDDFLDALGDAHGQAPDPQELERLRRVEQQFAAHQAQQSAPPPPKEQPSEKPKWSPPAISDTTQKLIDHGILKTDPQTGLFTGEPQFLPNINEANQWVDWQRRVGQRIIREPHNVAWEAGLDEKVNSLLEERLNELWERWKGEQSNQQAAKELEAFSAGDLKKMYDAGPDGQLQLNAMGKAYEAGWHQASALLGKGPQDTLTAEERRRIHEFALRSAQSVSATPESPQAASPADEGGQKREQFVERARRNGRQNRLSSRDITPVKPAEEEIVNDRDEDLVWNEARKQAEAEVT